MFVFSGVSFLFLLKEELRESMHFSGMGVKCVWGRIVQPAKSMIMYRL